MEVIKMFEKKTTWIDIIIQLIILCLFATITFWTSYLSGMALNLFAGEQVVSGLNLMFNTDRFTRDTLPLLSGVLGVIASKFRSRSTK